MPEQKKIRVDPDDGNLEWINTSDLLKKKIIPTTFEVLQEWSMREFRIDKPFTIHVLKTGMKNTVEQIKVVRIVEKLDN